MWSSTSRAFEAGTRTKRAVARVLIAASRLSRRRRGGLLRRAVRPEAPGEGELPQAVAHHVLRHVDGDEFPSVVHRQGVADELREDGGPSRPGLQHLLLARTIEILDPMLEPLFDVGSLLERTSHRG